MLLQGSLSRATLQLSRALAAVALVACAAACAGSASDAQAPIPLMTATPDEPRQMDESGTLDILSAPSTTVLVDGKPAGKTPISGYKVPPGRHDVTFVDEGGNRTMTVDLEPGEGKTVKSDRPPGIIEKKH